MKLIESILTKNPCYTAGRKITVKGLMLHSVGCNQPKASVFINSWNSPSYDRACVHGFIDANDGTVYQTLQWNHRGWHCGSGSRGSGNNTHIGVEMCEPACIKYTGGSSFTCSDLAAARVCVERTYQAAVELFAMLCRQYSLNPLADGIVISHKEGHARGIASNHGDPEHLWSQLGMGYTMDTFRKAVKALDIIPIYLSEGQAEGVRGDIAFAQSCLETGNFTFSGSAVTLDQNNFCGMGVTSNGLKGNSFDTPQLGIRAQIQHLKAYACADALVNARVDPRFKYVTRGCAEYVEWLGQQENPQGKGWAAGAGYGGKILSILKSICGTTGGTSQASPVWYRVRKTWADAKSQKGAFHELSNAKACADDNPGYSVFDESGKVIYTGKNSGSQASFQPYLVKVSIKLRRRFLERLGKTEIRRRMGRAGLRPEAVRQTSGDQTV